MSDIVERLRKTPHLSSLEEEAADEIERQQADIDKLMDERQGWLDEIERLTGVAFGLQEEIERLRDMLDRGTR